MTQPTPNHSRHFASIRPSDMRFLITKLKRKGAPAAVVWVAVNSLCGMAPKLTTAVSRNKIHIMTGLSPSTCQESLQLLSDQKFILLTKARPPKTAKVTLLRGHYYDKINPPPLSVSRSIHCPGCGQSSIVRDTDSCYCPRCGQYIRYKEGAETAPYDNTKAGADAKGRPEEKYEEEKEKYNQRQKTQTQEKTIYTYPDPETGEPLDYEAYRKRAWQLKLPGIRQTPGYSCYVKDPGSDKWIDEIGELLSEEELEKELADERKHEIRAAEDITEVEEEDAPGCDETELVEDAGIPAYTPMEVSKEEADRRFEEFLDQGRKLAEEQKGGEDDFIEEDYQR